MKNIKKYKSGIKALFCGVLLTLLPLLLLGDQPPQPAPERVILFIIDGLAVGATERLDMPNLTRLMQEGASYRAMHLPLPGHPEKSGDYPWSCSMANPMMMSGTPFIGIKGIREAMIQHQFKSKEAAFVVNAFSYEDVSGGFGTYISTPHRKDALVIENTKKVMLEEKPVFMRVHLQRAGIEGMKVSKERYSDQPYYRNIWHGESPYRIATERADRLLGDYITWLQEQDLWEGTVLLICGDHGQADEGWHEPYSPPSSMTPLVIAGSGVAPARSFDYSEMIDLAPTIAWLLGRKPPAHSIGRVLSEAFKHDLPAPDVPRLTEKLNEVLIAVHALNDEKKEELRAAGFLTIDELGLWHKTEAGNDFAAFVARLQTLYEIHR